MEDDEDAESGCTQRAALWDFEDGKRAMVALVMLLTSMRPFFDLSEFLDSKGVRGYPVQLYSCMSMLGGADARSVDGMLIADVQRALGMTRCQFSSQIRYKSYLYSTDVMSSYNHPEAPHLHFTTALRVSLPDHTLPEFDVTVRKTGASRGADMWRNERW